jgi:hypothetical protein
VFCSGSIASRDLEELGVDTPSILTRCWELWVLAITLKEKNKNGLGGLGIDKGMLCDHFEGGERTGTLIPSLLLSFVG